MEHKLRIVLDQSSVNTAMMKMASRIDEIGYPLAIVAILKGGAYTAYEILKLLNPSTRDTAVKKAKELRPNNPFCEIEAEMIEEVLAQRERPDIVIGHIGLESYGDKMKSSGEVKLMTPLDLSRDCLRGRKVVIVDDCIETGSTLKEAKKIVSGYNPNQIYTAVLVDKVALRMMRKEPDIVGRSYTGKGFLVGCGMGMGEKYRGLPEICEVVEDE